MIYRVLFLNFKEIKVLPKTHWEHIHEIERTSSICMKTFLCFSTKRSCVYQWEHAFFKCQFPVGKVHIGVASVELDESSDISAES